MDLLQFKNGSEIHVSELRKKERAGMSEAEIASELGISRMALYTARKRAGVPVLHRSDKGKPRLCDSVIRESRAAYMREYRARNPHVRYRTIYVDGKIKLEHRHVMEEKLGRKLDRHEVVHHLDGDRLNNEPSNLEVMNRSVHIRNHMKDFWDGRRYMIAYGDLTHSIRGWSELVGISYETLWTRLRWMDVEDALLTPLRSDVRYSEMGEAEQAEIRRKFGFL